MVYKLVARQDADGAWVGVAKASAEKTSTGGRKSAFRRLRGGVAEAELIRIDDADSSGAPADTRALQVPLVQHGDIDASHEGPDGVRAARSHHLAVRGELPLAAHGLSRSDPAIPTRYL
jgi:nicotinate phosphoribosyltransferase